MAIFCPLGPGCSELSTGAVILMGAAPSFFGSPNAPMYPASARKPSRPWCCVPAATRHSATTYAGISRSS